MKSATDQENAQNLISNNGTNLDDGDNIDVEKIEDNSMPLKLEVLMPHGVTKKELDLLREHGIYTVERLYFTPLKDIIAIKGMSEQKAERLKKICETLIPKGFCYARQYYEARQRVIRFTTGSKKLDTLLKGGIETGSVTELSGEYRTGKSQLCHTIAVTCQLPLSQGGAEGKCAWIDTEGTFRPERLVAIAKRYGLNPEDVLDNVVHAKAHNCDHQTELLVYLAGLFATTRYSLLIVDSATALYRSEFTGRGELCARQHHLSRFLRHLQTLTDEYGIAVVITNQVVSKVDGMSSMFGGAEKIPIGGNIMAHSSQTRLAFRKGRGESRICKIIDSPNLPPSEAVFAITEGGIDDYEEK